LLDESSSEGATQALKQEFIEGEGKVLVTSLRGTLTEGVDFDEDKLLSCIVCGVPIENVGSPKTKAVRTAYEDQFGGLGFDYGLTVPAVRKTRQALGRVIRGDDEVGVRVAADKRYSEGGQGSVRKYLSEKEQAEYESMDDVNEFYHELKAFWNAQS
jgi:Rad3-related DNA helicases